MWKIRRREQNKVGLNDRNLNWTARKARNSLRQNDEQIDFPRSTISVFNAPLNFDYSYQIIQNPLLDSTSFFLGFWISFYSQFDSLRQLCRWKNLSIILCVHWRRLKIEEREWRNNHQKQIQRPFNFLPFSFLRSFFDEVDSRSFNFHWYWIHDYSMSKNRCFSFLSHSIFHCEHSIFTIYFSAVLFSKFRPFYWHLLSRKMSHLRMMKSKEKISSLLKKCSWFFCKERYSK